MADLLYLYLQFKYVEDNVGVEPSIYNSSYPLIADLTAAFV